MKPPASLFLFTSALACCSWAALAQSPGPQPILELASPAHNFMEDFRGPTQRGGSNSVLSSIRGLAGLHLGHSTGPLKLNELQIRLPQADLTEKYCVRIASIDGRYWSLNPYQRSGKQLQSGIIETRSKFLHLLEDSYKPSDIVVRVVASDSCAEEANGPIVPLIAPGDANADTLVVYVNAPGDRASVRLLAVC
jgi:hypothetical protein